MKKLPTVPAVDTAAQRLRSFSLDAPPGALIGSEDELRERLGSSRNTLRQAARLLEREGFLRVRRGINGGYFSARPSSHNIEGIVGSYLETLEMEPEDVTLVASALWIQVLRKAARLSDDTARETAERFRKRLKNIKADATFEEVRSFEQESRTAIFKIARSPYVELIFNINTAFASRGFPRRPNLDDTPEHARFVRAWRDAKQMELGAIIEGDVELGAMAAQHIRDIWHRRLWNPEWLAERGDATEAVPTTGG